MWSLSGSRPHGESQRLCRMELMTAIDVRDGDGDRCCRPLGGSEHDLVMIDVDVDELVAVAEAQVEGTELMG